MVFTAAEDAKPKMPHKDGLPCLGCGALDSSWWRGPGGRYCCQKEAKAARDAEKADAKDKLIEELQARLMATEGGLAQALTAISDLSARLERHEVAAAEQEKQRAANGEALDDLRKQLCRVAQQRLMAPQPSKRALEQVGTKRRTLVDLSNEACESPDWSSRLGWRPGHSA